MKLVIVGYADMEDFYLFDEQGKQVDFDTDHVDTPAQFEAKYGGN